LQYFKDDLSGAAVLLMYGDDPRDATTIRGAVDDLAAGRARDLAVEGLPGFEAIDGCSPALAVAESDRGVEAVDPSRGSFRCELRPASWKTVAGLLEPFEIPRPGHRHQYLAGSGPLMWIVSTDADW
jgi:hypothetical protein